ncbi:MAG: RluA family pseudouridine synthase [Elusimicrobiota bacterium]|jgi:23S rRNA pseudouridine1911/1915/1917 synthase|nr:RluA family pseudouridine synthase [Elusimicrobiota bacterium]
MTKNTILKITNKNFIFENKRIDFFLKTNFPNYSRSYLQKLSKNNLILVNDKTVNPSYKLKKNDVIKIQNLEALKITKKIIPENIPIDIIFEDENIIVINKPSMMVVHPACGNFSKTLVNALLYHFNNLPLSQNSDKMAWARPGLVHRLDKETSGIMIIAKDEKSLYNLSKQFENRKIKKTYLAICYSKTDLEAGKINIAINRSNINRKKMALTSEANKTAKQAITYFKVLEKLKNNLVLIEAKPETGRTHQIRVHLQYVGYPILGDSLYGVTIKNFKLNFPLLEVRTLLHAYEIEFFHPVTNEKIKLQAKIPKDFKKILDSFRLGCVDTI